MGETKLLVEETPRRDMDTCKSLSRTQGTHYNHWICKISHNAQGWRQWSWLDEEQKGGGREYWNIVQAHQRHGRNRQREITDGQEEATTHRKEHDGGGAGKRPVQRERAHAKWKIDTESKWLACGPKSEGFETAVMGTPDIQHRGDANRGQAWALDKAQCSVWCTSDCPV